SRAFLADGEAALERGLANPGTREAVSTPVRKRGVGAHQGLAGTPREWRTIIFRNPFARHRGTHARRGGDTAKRRAVPFADRQHTKRGLDGGPRSEVLVHQPEHPKIARLSRRRVL